MSLLRNIPFISKNVYLEASTIANTNKVYLSIDLKICGFESLSLDKKEIIDEITVPQEQSSSVEIDFSKYFINNDTTCGTKYFVDVLDVTDE